MIQIRIQIHLPEVWIPGSGSVPFHRSATLFFSIKFFLVFGKYKGAGAPIRNFGSGFRRHLILAPRLLLCNTVLNQSTQCGAKWARHLLCLSPNQIFQNLFPAFQKLFCTFIDIFFWSIVIFPDPQASDPPSTVAEDCNCWCKDRLCWSKVLPRDFIALQKFFQWCLSILRTTYSPMKPDPRDGVLRNIIALFSTV
jgi:hypothetical protein